ncbi:MAG TPA: ABC transporter permease subunit [Burkholderiaceae bacterium]
MPGNRLRAALYQVALLGLLAALVAWLVVNLQANLLARGIPSGFDFLTQPAGFDIGESLLPFDAAQSYGRAFLVGLVNTLRVALPGMVLATLLGVAVGVARRSHHALLRGLGTGYVELLRNVPLLLQLLLWYLLCTEGLPAIDAPWQAGPLWLDKAGLHLGTPAGATLSPEYLALLLGLVLYTSAFIAEVVRAGLGAVARGQIQAAQALGLSPGQVLRIVTLPQALRLVVPPLTNQYLNLTKNSSLAVAIGYPDLVSVANTAINQTGRAVECIVVIMLVYLATSLLTALVMGRYNARVALRGN